VYLGGNISHDPETYEWRRRFTEIVRLFDAIEPIDPCASRYSDDMFKKWHGLDITEEAGVRYTAEAQARTKGLLPDKDYWLLKSCDVNVVNLMINTPGRPMIGTVFEMAWCRDIFNIPCIGITGGPDFESAYTVHPFIQRALTSEVPTGEEAADLIASTYLT